VCRSGSSSTRLDTTPLHFNRAPPQLDLKQAATVVVCTYARVPAAAFTDLLLLEFCIYQFFIVFYITTVCVNVFKYCYSYNKAIFNTNLSRLIICYLNSCLVFFYLLVLFKLFSFYFTVIFTISCIILLLQRYYYYYLLIF